MSKSLAAEMILCLVGEMIKHVPGRRDDPLPGHLVRLKVAGAGDVCDETLARRRGALKLRKDPKKKLTFKISILISLP